MLAVATGACSADRPPAPPASTHPAPTATAVIDDAAFSAYDSRVLEVSTALGSFGTVLADVTGDRLRRDARRLASARAAFARAVAAAARVPAPPGLAAADRLLRAAWAHLDAAMRDIVRAARHDDPAGFRAADRQLIAAAAEAQRAGDAYARAAAP
jgi:hypothetical protein